MNESWSCWSLESSMCSWWCAHCCANWQQRLQPTSVHHQRPCVAALQARSQEARANWESALSSKDRAIQQLEEALSSRQRAIDQLLSVTPNAVEQEALLEKATKARVGCSGVVQESSPSGGQRTTSRCS